MMATPAEGRSPAFAPVWAADNGCFGRGWPGEAAWLAWLERHATHAGRCLFATAPDVLGEGAATLTRSLPWLGEIRRRGYPAALVAQEGTESLDLPWETFDVLFLGGRDAAWKLGPAAATLVAQALQHHKKVHFGRCNSAKRWRHAHSLGCYSADGTFLTFAPDANLARLRRWTQTRPPRPIPRSPRPTRSPSTCAAGPRRTERPVGPRSGP
jgi:hypothetical protein